MPYPVALLPSMCVSEDACTNALRDVNEARALFGSSELSVLLKGIQHDPENNPIANSLGPGWEVTEEGIHNAVDFNLTIMLMQLWGKTDDGRAKVTAGIAQFLKEFKEYTPLSREAA